MMATGRGNREEPSRMGELVFVKLGGSVITHKTKPETARLEVIARLAREVVTVVSNIRNS